jgi:hypothetical protein
MCEDTETRNARCVTGAELADSVSEGRYRRSVISCRCLWLSEEVLNAFMHRVEETPSTPRAQIMRRAVGEDRTT